MKLSLLNALTIVSLAFSVNSLYAAEVNSKPQSHDVALGTSPQFVIDAKKHIHVLYQSLSPDGLQKPDIIAIESEDGGGTWSKPVNVSNTPALSSQASVCLDRNGAIFTAWRDTRGDDLNPDIFFASSHDGGKSWTKPVDISNTPGDSSHPSIAVSSDGAIHVVWCDTSKGDRNRDIFYSCSRDAGKTWGMDTLLPAEDISNTAGASNEPKIAVDDNDDLHVVWCDSTPGKRRPDIFYVQKSRGHWGKPQDLSDNTRISSHPGVACGPDGLVYLVWSDTSQELHLADVWCVTGANGKFGKPINVSNTAGVSTQPTVAADETGRVAFIWSDTSVEYSKPEIFARVSHDKTGTLSRLIDMSNTQGSSKYAQLAINRDKLYVIWEEDDGGVTHIMMSDAIF